MTDLQITTCPKLRHSLLQENLKIIETEKANFESVEKSKKSENGYIELNRLWSDLSQEPNGVPQKEERSRQKYIEEHDASEG
jgi:hypothetical protein